MNPLRALVIDDEQIVLDSVQKILAAEGFAVDLALRSSTGLHRALNREYDIVAQVSTTGDGMGTVMALEVQYVI